MKKNLLLSLLAAGIFGAATAHAQHVFTNWDENHLWSNPGNWNQPAPPDGDVAWINFTTDEAVIDYAAPSISELVIGQGGGDGAVRMTAGGSITTSHINIAWGTDRSGILEIDGGEMISGQLRMGREAGVSATVNISGGIFTTSQIQMSSRVDGGVPAGADSFLNISGGTVTSPGALQLGHQGGNATLDMTGGTVTINNQMRIGNVDTASTANGSFSITGGSFTVTQLTAVGTVGEGMGRGSITIGGDAEFTFGQSNASIVLRAGENSFTVIGSNATINSLRAAGTALEFNDGNEVNFVFDEGGVSTVQLLADIRFGGTAATGHDVILNVDASAVDEGIYALFTFGGYHAPDGTWATTFGTENLTFAPGLTGDIVYGANDISLHIIPEPGTYAAIFGGLALLGAFAYRRRFRVRSVCF